MNQTREKTVEKWTRLEKKTLRNGPDQRKNIGIWTRPEKKNVGIWTRPEKKRWDMDQTRENNLMKKDANRSSKVTILFSRLRL